MWIFVLAALLIVLCVLAALCYLRLRADEDEAAANNATLRQARERATEYREYLNQKARQYELDDQRRRAAQRW